MPRLVKTISLLLALLWLPATLHCVIEDSGLIEHLSLCHGDDGHSCGCDGSKDLKDSCHIIEGGEYRIVDSNASVPTPALHLLFVLDLALASLDAPPLVSTTSPASSDAPPELARTWHFATRSAPAPRAPSLILA